MKLSGKIVSFFNERNYGFIIEDRNGRAIRYFFHRTNLPDIEPKVGMKVLFDFVQAPKGLAAVDIEIANVGGAQC
jgi:cold shock CspA family protein